MSRKKSGRPSRRLAIAGVATALLAVSAGCGADGGDEGGEILRFGTYIPTSSLDPVVNSGFGVAGGIELMAVYDTVMSWDPETGEYAPRTAEELAPNEDHTVWTLTLQDGIKFTDGTPYDAEAVKFNLDRFRVGNAGAPDCEETRSCPAVSVASISLMPQIEGLEVKGDLELEIRLSESWATFPLVLAGEPGMVVSPTAVREACAPDAPVVECSFGLEPVGAGPFKVDSFAPGESVKLVANEDYWGGEPELAGVTFSSYNDGGGTTTAEALLAGSLDMAFVRTPQAVASVKSAGLEGYSAIQQGGQISFLNTGRTVECKDGEPASCKGRPDGPYTPPTATSMVEVRQAISAAVNREQLFQQLYSGEGLPGAELFQESHRLSPGVEGVDYDLDRAKELVAQAKAKGWDGKVRVDCMNYESDRGVALKAMLEAAGMQVDLNTQNDQAAQAEIVNLRGDYDVACSGVPISSDDFGLRNGLDNNLLTDAPRNRTGYSSDEMDAALAGLRVAASDEEKRAALADVVTIFNRDVPWLVEGATEEFVAWSDRVSGVTPTQESLVYLDRVTLG